MSAPLHPYTWLSIKFSDMYVQEALSGQCDGQAKPTIIKETPGTAYVDGHNGIGSVSNLIPSYCRGYLSLVYQTTPSPALDVYASCW
jgi:hypothetical protein